MENTIGEEIAKDDEVSEVAMLELEIEDLMAELEAEKKQLAKEQKERQNLTMELDAEKRRSAKEQAQRENMTVELDEEKQKWITQQEDCTKHLQKLKDTEERLLHYQTAVENREQQISGGDISRSLTPPRSPETEGNEQINESQVEGSSVPVSTLQQIRELESQVEAFRRESSAAKADAATRMKEMDDLRNYYKGAEQRRSKMEMIIREAEEEKANARESDAESSKVREVEMEMEKRLNLKEATISRQAQKIEELQEKNRRLPQLASKLAKFEASANKMKSQTTALAEEKQLIIQSFEQKERDMTQHIQNLEATLSRVESSTADMALQKEIISKQMKADNDRLAKLVAKLQAENESLAKDAKEGIAALEEVNRQYEALLANSERLEKDLRRSRRRI
jgi:outer membrane murein-binding lipoprotein Lpp